MTVLRRAIRVLIIDDSPFIRMALNTILSKDHEIEVVDTARDGREGIAKVLALKPDVVTMDIEMPVMNGIEALEEIMRRQPTPVIVLSSVTTDGARQTMEAFDLGAVEVIAKPSGKEGNTLTALAEEIIIKIKGAAGINPKLLINKGPAVPGPSLVNKNMRSGQYPGNRTDIVGIGVSTGGPTALQKVLSQLPKDFPVPVIIAQHMPAGFTASLASRLDSLSGVRVKEVEDGEVLKGGTAYIGKAGMQFQIKRDSKGFVARVDGDAPIETLYKPSVDIMFLSMARESGRGVLAVVMTGMGNDGLKGMKALKAQGAYSIAESEKTCIVYGMPRSVVEAGLVDRIELLPNIGKTIIECVQRR